MEQLEKKIKAVDAYAKKYKKQLASRPVLNQIKVIEISLDLNRTSLPIVITGKETGIKVIVAIIRVLG